ncbi:MAG: CAAD domain-containing protein [Leptolyngbyaceae cyanobacterium MO_188.B28]|nr:CAAD domain-containing protein [Leptolyngbyaceae cyanobacterium MO_188.B28]
MSTELQKDTESGTPEQPPLNQEYASSGGASMDQAQQVWAKISGLLGDLPDFVSDFFNEYRRPIITIGIILGGLIAAKLALAILEAINEIPLLAPTFEIIGLGYSVWFGWRYIRLASKRQELLEDINALKDQVLGKGS